MPKVPPGQVSQFPNSRRPVVRQRDPEPPKPTHGIIGRPRGPPPPAAPPIQPRVLRTPHAAKYVGLTASTLEKMRLVGSGPPFVRLGARAVGYAIGDLDSYIDARRRTSTSDPGICQPRPGQAETISRS
jgi:predicted DNA-binding transcriptional regulator AlpA